MINIGDKYQHIRTGNQYEVVDCGKQTSPNGTYEDYVVWYRKVGETAKAYPRLESRFLNSFKPYEPVYAYQWAIKDEYGKAIISPYMTEQEVNDAYDLEPSNRVRLDFTKRERK